MLDIYSINLGYVSVFSESQLHSVDGSCKFGRCNCLQVYILQVNVLEMANITNSLCLSASCKYALAGGLTSTSSCIFNYR